MEKQTLADENDKATRSISIIRELLNDESFKDEHRTVYKFFTIKSKLDFVAVRQDNFTCIASNRYSLF
jgi:negative regulator of replication initiation